ncbi:108_t:CDS:2 [Acaulospora morrowiae]|uniref:108_t:CDS:1 n=1 Tax=Acaulospora morrowiae TaxID=94023 RepID=A0A9N9HEY3_9GLOM|nr:108_t:CDS:2 [Acaulospora morrowiae]
MSKYISVNFQKSSKDKSEIVVKDGSSSKAEKIDVAPREVEKSKKISTNKVEVLQTSNVSSFSYDSKKSTVNNTNTISTKRNKQSSATKENLNSKGQPRILRIVQSKKLVSVCYNPLQLTPLLFIILRPDSVLSQTHDVSTESRNDYTLSSAGNAFNPSSRSGYEPQVSAIAGPSGTSLKSEKKKKINIRYIPYESVPPPVKPDSKLLFNHLNKPLQKFTTGVIAAQNFPKATNGDLHKICDKYDLKPNLVVKQNISKLYEDTSMEKIIADIEDRVMEDMTLRCALRS